jgi:hypothetical protein
VSAGCARSAACASVTSRLLVQQIADRWRALVCEGPVPFRSARHAVGRGLCGREQCGQPSDSEFTRASARPLAQASVHRHGCRAAATASCSPQPQPRCRKSSRHLAACVECARPTRDAIVQFSQVWIAGQLRRVVENKDVAISGQAASSADSFANLQCAERFADCLG